MTPELEADVDKHAVLQQLTAQLQAELERARTTQLETARGATHEEAKPENDKDTRALEQTYLARGLAERVEALGQAVSVLSTLKLRAFDSESPVALGALVTLQAPDDGALAHYFIVPAGGGVRLDVGGLVISTVTPSAPLGRALIGAYEGDEVSVRTPQGSKSMDLARVC